MDFDLGILRGGGTTPTPAYTGSYLGAFSFKSERAQSKGYCAFGLTGSQIFLLSCFTVIRRRIYWLLHILLQNNFVLPPNVCVSHYRSGSHEFCCLALPGLSCYQIGCLKLVSLLFALPNVWGFISACFSDAFRRFYCYQVCPAIRLFSFTGCLKLVFPTTFKFKSQT